MAGVDDGELPVVDEPYALELRGDWERAAELWDSFGCPYDAAIALVNSGDETAMREALDRASGARRARGRRRSSRAGSATAAPAAFRAGRARRRAATRRD